MNTENDEFFRDGADEAGEAEGGSGIKGGCSTPLRSGKWGR